MLRILMASLAAILLVATAEAASQPTKFTLPSGTKIVVEVLGKARNRSTDRLVLYATVEVPGLGMTEERANVIADDAFEFLLGGMAISSKCDAVMVTIDRSGGRRPYSSYYATVSPLNFRVEGRKETAPDPPYSRQGPIALPSGKAIFVDRQFDGQANYLDKPGPAVFAEFDVDGAQLDGATKYSLLREYWLTQLKPHADAIGAVAFRVVLNEKLPESRFDFGRRSYLYFTRTAGNIWPSLPERPDLLSSVAPLGFGDAPTLDPSAIPEIEAQRGEPAQL